MEKLSYDERQELCGRVWAEISGLRGYSNAVQLLLETLTNEQLKEFVEKYCPEDEAEEEWDSHRYNPGFCAKCGGQCYFDADGNRIIANQDNLSLPGAPEETEEK